PLLAEWGKSLQRDEIVLAMAALPSESAPANLGTTNGQRVNGILYSAANATQRNTWNQANQDRILYGNAFSNYNATHATALANLTATDDRFSAATVRLAREKAEDASPKIDPLTTNDGYERFIMFVGSRAYRDAWADPEIYQATRTPVRVRAPTGATTRSSGRAICSTTTSSSARFRRSTSTASSPARATVALTCPCRSCA